MCIDFGTGRVKNDIICINVYITKIWNVFHIFLFFWGGAGKSGEGLNQIIIGNKGGVLFICPLLCSF